MSLTNYSENALLNHIFENTAYTNVATVYIALGSTAALEDGTGFTEATYGSYARKAIAFDAAATRQIVQTSQIDFPQSTSGDETYQYYAIFDALTTGNMLAYGSMTSAINVVTNSTPSIAAGEVKISVNAGGGASGNGMSDYLANKLLDFMFRNQVFAQPNLHVTLTTAAVTDGLTGTTITEPSGNNFARVDFGDWTVATTGTLNNGTNIQFSVPSGTWGTVTSSAIVDASTAGNLLMYDNDHVVDQTIGLNDDVKFLASQFVVSLN